MSLFAVMSHRKAINRLCTASRMLETTARYATLEKVATFLALKLDQLPQLWPQSVLRGLESFLFGFSTDNTIMMTS
jgi:hypothetical protein